MLDMLETFHLQDGDFYELNLIFLYIRYFNGVFNKPAHLSHNFFTFNDKFQNTFNVE